MLPMRVRLTLAGVAGRRAGTAVAVHAPRRPSRSARTRTRSTDAWLAALAVSTEPLVALSVWQEVQPVAPVAALLHSAA